MHSIRCGLLLHIGRGQASRCRLIASVSPARAAEPTQILSVVWTRGKQETMSYVGPEHSTGAYFGAGIRAHGTGVKSGGQISMVVLLWEVSGGGEKVPHLYYERVQHGTGGNALVMCCEYAQNELQRQ